jgi:hypothetical protein
MVTTVSSDQIPECMHVHYAHSLEDQKGLMQSVHTCGFIDFLASS